MLSIRISARRILRVGALLAGLAVLAACADTRTAGTGGPLVDPGEPVKVALLVPLGTGDTGRERIGQNMVNAANLAQGDLRNAAIELVVYPTRGTTEGGASAAAQAIAEGAQIIVGPLQSTETAGVQPVAAQAGLKVLSFSNNPSVAGENVYLLGNTFQNTASQLVAFAQSQGLQNIAVVYPNGLEGETARNAVAQAVQSQGATLVTSQGYNLSVEAIAAATGPAAAALLGTGADAVILTDGPTGGLAFIADGLRNNGLSPSDARFLGLQRWDITAEALAQPGLQGGVFAAPDPAILGNFNGRYQNAFGEAPHELAGLAYDGIAAVGALIAEARGGGEGPFSDARLTQPSGFAGSNGPFRFTPGGLSQRNLAILEVQSGQATVIQRASRNFDAVGL